MGVIIINPNSTEAMTTAMLETARAAAPDLNFEGWTSSDGPASIQGEDDGASATTPLLELIAQAQSQKPDGIIIGCFDDTALAEAQRLSTCPVIGIGQAAFFYAALNGWRFSVVTTLQVSVPIIESNIRAFGLGGYLSEVRASNVPVLDLENNPVASGEKIVLEARRAEQEDGIDALVLGCAGMVNVSASVNRALSCTVIDPVVAAARSMIWLR